MNEVVLIGRLTRKPELSYTPSTQTAVAKFTIAVDRPRRNGQEQTADFLRIVVFGKQAENCDRYLDRGREVAVHGRIETGSYKNKEGITVYTTDIIADRVRFLGGRGEQNAPQNTFQGGSPEYSAPTQQNQRYGNQGYERGTGNSGPAQSYNQGYDDGFGGFGDLPDTFQAAEDDIPF